MKLNNVKEILKYSIDELDKELSRRLKQNRTYELAEANFTKALEYLEPELNTSNNERGAHRRGGAAGI